VTTWLNTPIQMQFRVIDGLTVRFAESEDRDEHALLLSPWPESLLAFAPTWARLAEHTHLVAVDLPGFGHSERRDALLSPQAMGEFIIRLADAFGLEHPHVAGPDVGTGAGLFAAARHPTASSTSSTRATSPGKTQPTSTQHWSPAGGPEATRRPDLDQPADRDRSQDPATRQRTCSSKNPTRATLRVSWLPSRHQKAR
jgi:pimeloyl-ACP methyl ester carboxylesterase